MKRAVVIGAGAGGLTAALLLVRHGWDVTVLEQHYRAGGFLHRFFRQAMPYDTGFHYCGGVAWEDIFGRCLRHLDVWKDLRFLPLDPDGFDRILFPDLDFRVPVGVLRYRDALKEAFPHEARGIDAYVDEIDYAVSAYGLYAFKAHVEPAEVLGWEELSLAAVLDRHVRDPRLRRTLAGQCMLFYALSPAEAPFGLHAVILHHFLKGAWRIEGGGDRLAMTLVRRLREQGGRLRLKSSVVRVETQDRLATAVVIESGERIPADLVISNVHPKHLVQMIGPEALRPAYRRRVEEQRVGRAHIGLYAELDGGTELLGNRNLYRFQHEELDRAFELKGPPDLPFYFATSPTQGHSLAHQVGRNQVLLMLAGMPWEAVAPWAHTRPEDRPAEYHQLKDQYQEVLLAAIEADHPGIGRHILRVECSTPLSTAHFVRAPEGAMYGHRHSIEQMGRYRPAQALRVKNCVQVGAGVFWPGVLGAMISAYYGVAYTLGMQPLLDELLAIPRDDEGRP